MKERMVYDHRRHAGNAGDLYKHLVLAEVAGHLFEAGIQVYVESHAGRPEYFLSPGGEWEGGIGRIWPRRRDLAKYGYFQIVGDLNPSALERYPGSASIVVDIARRNGIDLRAELWDTSPLVEMAWRSGEDGKRPQGISFHPGDGFSGVSELLDGLDEPALLFIDSPYIEEGDAILAGDLISRSAKAGWVALSWQPIDIFSRPPPDCDHLEFQLDFEEAGLECASMKGAAMILVWDGEKSSIPMMDALDERLSGIKEDLYTFAAHTSESF